MVILRRYLGVLMILILSVCLVACTQEEMPVAEVEDVVVPVAEAAQTFDLAALQEDFAKMKSTIDYFHPKLYTDVNALNALMDSQYAMLEEGMTAIEFYRVVAPIVSALRCGHTFIGLSDEEFSGFIDTAQFLPFSIYWHEGKALVNASAAAPELPIGAEIISINGVPMTDVMAGLLENIGADGTNETLKIRAINDGFRYHYALDNPALPTIPVEYLAQGETTPVSILVLSKTQTELLTHGDSIWGQMGLASRNNSSSFEQDYALLRMASFYPYGGDTVTTYNAFIDTFFQKVKEDGVQAVILDVRDNFGGDPSVGAHLFSYLAKEAAPYFAQTSGFGYPSLVSPVALSENHFSGELYVLMNGNCFSTTGHFLALLKYHDIGTFIGEESGGSYACSDASKSISLINTKLQFRYSTKVFEVAVEGLTPGRGVMPDYPVTASLSEQMAKTDIEMAVALKLIHGE